MGLVGPGTPRTEGPKDGLWEYSVCPPVAGPGGERGRSGPSGTVRDKRGQCPQGRGSGSLVSGLPRPSRPKRDKDGVLRDDYQGRWSWPEGRGHGGGSREPRCDQCSGCVDPTTVGPDRDPFDLPSTSATVPVSGLSGSLKAYRRVGEAPERTTLGGEEPGVCRSSWWRRLGDLGSRSHWRGGSDQEVLGG